MNGTILVALDGSAQAEEALPIAAALAGRFETGLLLVQPVAPRRLPPFEPQTSRTAEIAQAQHYLRSVAARVGQRHPCLRVAVAVTTGRAAEAIADEALLARAGVIVAATRPPLDGEAGGAALGTGLGRAAEAAAHRAGIPVLLILAPTCDGGAASSPASDAIAAAWRTVGAGDHGATLHRHRTPPLRVVVPLSGSAAAAAVLPHLALLASRLPVVARVVHVVTPLLHGESERVAPAEPFYSRVWATHIHVTPRPLCWANAAGYCRGAVSWLERHGVPASFEVRSGDSAEEIGRAALDGADLVMLGVRAGSHGAWTFHSTVDRLRRALRCPVWLLHSTSAGSTAASSDVMHSCSLRPDAAHTETGNTDGEHESRALEHVG